MSRPHLSGLRQLGYLGKDVKKLTIDGRFGDNTLHAVNAFNIKNMLYMSPGTVDSLTAGLMFSDVAIGRDGDKGSFMHVWRH